MTDSLLLELFHEIPAASQAVAWMPCSLLVPSATNEGPQATLLAAPPIAARQRELQVSRTIARQLLQKQGCRDVGALQGVRQSVRWPHGFLGSISHTEQLVAVVALPCGPYRAVGIDVEAYVAADTQQHILRYCLLPGEYAHCRHQTTLPDRQLLTLLFSAKEALFKCLYPKVGRYFDFDVATCLEVDVTQGRIHLSLAQSLRADMPAGRVFCGTFQFVADHVFTAFTMQEE